MKNPTISDAALREAAASMDSFVAAVVGAISEAAGGELTAEALGQLKPDQITLWGYWLMREELMDGGFVQLIHNGLGPFIFLNPFAKALRLWGLHDLSKLVYKGRKLYEAKRQMIERELTDEEFMALYEQLPEFDDLDDAFLVDEEAYTEQVARYVDEHLTDFVEIV
ncbi:MAG: DMP19 family protein [Bacteroidaceae bacterium]|nr:DMP19 family protein [Candidatus Equimonas faecalis]MCQ2205840.1 DMP19 family protein [Bacteroidaceae bacterium]